MKREILFRGKRVDNGQWVEGSLSMVDTRSQKIGKKYGQMFICQVQTAWQNTENGKLVGYWIEVTPESVGQFTGLFDKNGKKIFEGDLLHRHLGVHWIVEFKKSIWVATSVNGSALYLDYYQFKEAEITRNIHDNPELL